MKTKAASLNTAVSPKGKKRVQEILKVATEVFAYEGYVAFTVRNIAAKLGLTHRNLQYYFPTKTDLFQAVVEQMTNNEITLASEAIYANCENPKDKLIAFVHYSIQDNRRPLVVGFQHELWAIATRDDFAASCRDKMIIQFINFVNELIKPLTPSNTAEERLEKASMIQTLLIGSSMMMSDPISELNQCSDLESRIIEQVLLIVQ